MDGTLSIFCLVMAVYDVCEKNCHQLSVHLYCLLRREECYRRGGNQYRSLPSCFAGWLFPWI